MRGGGIGSLFYFDISKELERLMFKEYVYLFLFIAVLVGMVNLSGKREIGVTVCESGGVTTYVGRRIPMEGMTFGECRLIKVSANRYWEMKRVMSNSNGGFSR